MTIDLEEFYTDLMQEVWAEADGAGKFSESSFVEAFANYLIDAGEFDTFDYTPYRITTGHGSQVDGYAGDPIDYDGVLTLVVSDFNQDGTMGSLTRTDMEKLFRRVERFFTSSLQEPFHQQMEESSPGYGLAQLIHQRKGRIGRVRFFLLSNRNLSTRVLGMEEKEIGGYRFSYSVWDISRLHRLIASGKGKEDLDIDLVQEYGATLPCLPAHLRDAGYEAYLAVLPGSLLADIYDRWGARLLEQNVRCFLQARGNVNKGIRATILNNSEMFFAYNNGITATAEAVETEDRKGSLHITRLKNLQIVNGGQTTASIFTCRKRDKASLDNLFVQMKLSIVEPERTMEVVPKISEYANTQNRVNAADFFANHPYHVRMQDCSRRIYAPSPDGSFRESKWFYERARGQYLDAQSLMTKAQKNKFKLEYPRPQVFAKTDLAKFENVWEGIPHIVSKGAQFNFAQFAKTIGGKWEKSSDQFNEHYYKSAIARAIIFRRLEKVVMEQPWYDGGYRANIVAYTVSKLADIVIQKGKSLNFLGIWQRQNLSPALRDALVQIAGEVHKVVVDTPDGISNVSEWAKKPACWERTRNLDITLPQAFLDELIGPGEVRTEERAAKNVQKIDNGIQAQKEVIDLGGDFWKKAVAWARANKVGSEKDHQIMDVAARFPARLPSEKQSLHLMGVLDALKEEGYPDL